MRGDFNGDGRLDTFAIYATFNGSKLGQAFVRVVLATGGGASLSIGEAGAEMDPMPFELVGTSDLDSNGSAEAWIRVYIGANFYELNMFSWSAGRVAQATDERGTPFELLVGGGRYRWGARCDASGRLIVLNADFVRSDTFNWTDTTLRLENRVILVKVNSRSGQYRSDGNLRLRQYGRFECGNISYVVS